MIHVTKGAMERRAIALPPLAEQKRIVAILDEAFEGIDAAIANTEKNLANARELFDSYLNAIFSHPGEGWVETTIGEEVSLLTGFAFKSSEYSSDDDDINLLRGDNIVQGKFRWENVKKWPRSRLSEFQKFMLAEDDVVVAMDRTWIKGGIKYAKISAYDLPCLLLQRVARLRCLENLDPEFLFYVIGSKCFMDYVLSIQTGLGVPHVSGPQLQTFKFFRPDIETQSELVDKLAAFSGHCYKLIEQYDARLASLAEFKQSLLAKAFSGDLTADLDKALQEAAA